MDVCFNPLPHAEGDFLSFFFTFLLDSFNPLPHAEGDPLCRYVPFCTMTFQSTPSRRGRLSQFITITPISLFQSTPSRRGRLRSRPIFVRCQFVSIHSLTQRETCYAYEIEPTAISFNPLPHAEGDVDADFRILFITVSIHSLTQRETRAD